MKKLLLCLVALFAAIGAQASTQTIEKGSGTSGTSTVKFGATDKPDITAKAVYTLTLNADNKLEVELTFVDLNNSDIEGLGNDPCYMFIEGIGETSLTYANGKYTGTTAGAATPGNFYSNCYFKRACANNGTNYGVNGELIFPFQFTAPKDGIYFELKLGEPTITTNSYSFPYEFVVHPEDTDLTGAEFSTRLEYIGGGNYTDYTAQNGTIEQTGLTDNTTYTIYPKGTVTLNGTTYTVTNQDKTFTITTLEDAEAVKFSIDAKQIAATGSSVTMHYKFVPTGDVPEGTTYSLWFDVQGFNNEEIYVTDAEGDITITGLEPDKNYNLWTKGYYTLPNSGKKQVSNFDQIFTAKTSIGGEISGTVSDITKTTATLTLNCEPADGKTVEKIVVSGLGEGKDITFTSTENLTANLTNLVPGTTYNLTFTLTYTDASTAEANQSFTTLEGTKPSITFTNINDATNITTNSAEFTVTITLANPDNYPIEYWRVASARAANDQKLEDVTYEKWPYNEDLIWGQYRSTEKADGSYTVTIPLTNLPAATNINNYFKSEIKLPGSDAYESNGGAHKAFTTLEIGSVIGRISNITHNSATLTLTSVPETVTSVAVSGLGEGKDFNVDLESKTAELTGLDANTTYTLTLTATNNNNTTSTTTVSFTTLTAPKEVSMEFIEVNVSDLSALFKLKVDLTDNDQSKEFIHMYLRKADETFEATEDDPYAIYGEAKGTPAVDPRWKNPNIAIENPVFFNYTELEKNTKYIATAVVKKDGYYGVATKEFTTSAEAINTTSYIENGYFMDGVKTLLPDNTEKFLVYLASARYTFTYDKVNEVLYLTFDTRIRNDNKLPVLQSKYMLNVNGSEHIYYGNPTNSTGYKDHYSFVINNQCADIATLIKNGTPLHFTYLTDYENGGKSYFKGFDYDGTTSSEDFGEPADVKWIDYSYAEQVEQNKNRYDLYKKVPKTQLMATVIDGQGHYLPRRIVEFEMVTEDNEKATVTCDNSLGQPKWFVEAASLADATSKEAYFNVVAFHQLEDEAAPAGSPRRAVSADGKRLEAKKVFYYIESDTPTGIDDIKADDANAPVRYFDLNGREISEPQKGMFVIRLQGSKATKMIIK